MINNNRINHFSLCWVRTILFFCRSFLYRYLAMSRSTLPSSRIIQNAIFILLQCRVVSKEFIRWSSWFIYRISEQFLRRSHFLSHCVEKIISSIYIFFNYILFGLISSISTSSFSLFPVCFLIFIPIFLLLTTHDFFYSPLSYPVGVHKKFITRTHI